MASCPSMPRSIQVILLWVQDFLSRLAFETDFSAKKRKGKLSQTPLQCTVWLTFCNRGKCNKSGTNLWLFSLHNTKPAPLLHGKVDYTKNGMANKLKELRLTEQRRRWSSRCFAQSSSLCLQRGQKLINSLCESVLRSRVKMSVMLWFSPQPSHSTSWVVVM